MGYFSTGKKIVIIGSLVLLGVLNSIAAAEDLGFSPRAQAFLLSPKKTFEYYCSPCHGQKGKGDGTFFTIDLKPKPRNFLDVEYMKKRTDEQLTKSITDGSKSVDKSNLCPPWGKTLTEKRIKELVVYIRNLSLQEAEKTVVAAKESVVEVKKPSVFKSSARWLFLIVITLALAIGAIGEWKKLKKESLPR
ncbi:MAG: c-type cytochrome [Planctomycetes bacterium]|nr:c-type cytochrome [Planctomycetota bacterium]